MVEGLVVMAKALHDSDFLVQAHALKALFSVFVQIQSFKYERELRKFLDMSVIDSLFSLSE